MLDVRDYKCVNVVKVTGYQCLLMTDLCIN